MTPDEFPEQDSTQDPMTPPSQPEDSDYTPQPLPDVLAGGNPHPPSRENVVADPWVSNPMASDSVESDPAPGAEMDGVESEAPVSAMGPESTGEDMSPMSAGEEGWGDRPEPPQGDSPEEPPVEIHGETPSSEDAADDVPEESIAPAAAEGEEVIDLEPIEEDLTEEEALEQRVLALRQEEETLRLRLLELREEIAETQSSVGQLVIEGLRELEQRRQGLQLSVEKLERRQERIQAEMQSTFAGSSQELSVRIQGFKDYLVGSLQDLVSAAEDLRLTPPPAAEPTRRAPKERQEPEAPATPEFAAQRYQDASRKIRKLLDQYRTAPDYYGPPWQLRRTFEPIHAERVADWFFEQGGRGAIRTMGSRLQNVLVASAAISVLHRMYGDRFRALILSDSPERLGEWRRGLQDCLGLGRMDFGSNQGVTLFDAPEPMAQRADRLLQQQYLPLIIIDESEGVVDLSLLQFPLWIAFAIDPMKPPMVY
ncbi:MAG: DUF3086 domain-containing protein [Cyanobacteria bacterium J06638_22]